MRTYGLVLLLLLFASAAAAQTPRDASRDLEAVLSPGRTVWITDATGRRDKTRIVSLSGDIVTTTAADGMRRLRTAEIVQVTQRHSDSLLNGALIGAGIAVGSGLALCRAMEPWENCRDDIGPMLRLGAVGAAVGMGIDALIRGQRTIYQAAPGPIRLSVAPLVGGRAKGVQLALRF